jgi:hypothetical protein
LEISLKDHRALSVFISWRFSGREGSQEEKKKGRRGKVRDGVVGFVADWTMARVRIFSHPSDLPSLSF